MAIAYVSSTAYTETNADLPTTTSFSHSVGAGSDRLLVVSIAVDQDTQLCTAVAYGGVSLTRACRLTDSANLISEIWYLKNPASGANNVTANWTNTTGDVARLVASDFTGVDQTTPLDTTATDFDTDGDEDTTYSYTTGVADALIVGTQATDQSTKPGTPTASWNEIDDNAYSGRSYTGYRIVSGAAGAYTIGWTIPTVSSTLDSTLAMASFKPSSVSTLTVSVSDSSTVTESKTVTVTGGTPATLTVSVSDSSTVTESKIITTSAVALEVLVVAGGGSGGGSQYHGAGGGAGGVSYLAAGTATARTYSVTVGAGGAALAGNATTQGNDGGASDFDILGDIPVHGTAGGGGAAYLLAGRNGGSGGGGARSGGAAGTGVAGEGYAGGIGINSAPNYGSGGGGGKGGVGADGTSTSGGNGGDGVSTYSDLLILANIGEDISGTHWIGGGGGGGTYAGGTNGLGGKGGGGDATDTVGTDAQANTGGGGGGPRSHASNVSGAGGSGVVIIRYVTANFGSCTGGTITTDANYTCHTFTADGTFTAVLLGSSSVSVNVSDSSTITESRTAFIPTLVVSKSDSSTVTESKTVSRQEATTRTVSVSDASTATEALTTRLFATVSVSDASTITESLTAFRTPLYVSVSDSSTVTEAVTTREVSVVSVSDSSTATESLTVQLVAVPTLAISVSDASTATESVTPRELSYVSISDSSTVTESVAVQIASIADLTVSVTDSSTATESLKLQEVSVVSVSDSSTLTESLTSFRTPLYVSVSDTSTATEAVTVTLVAIGSIVVSVSDISTVTESLAVFRTPLQVSVSDASTVTENLSVTIPGTAPTNHFLSLLGVGT